MFYLLTGLLFVLLFGIVQGIVYLISGTTPAKEAKKQIEKIKNSQGFIRFVYDKQIQLKKMGAGVLLKDHLTVSQWYLFKALMAGLFGLIAFFISAGVLKSDMAKPISIGAGIIGWFFLDLILRLKNKASNDEMMPDIMEMSRSVLYGKRGGQYIADALKDSVIVVENKRLKTALLRLRNDLESGFSLDECLDELELSFSNGEISSFCTVIKSLQSIGQVDEALRTMALLMVVLTLYMAQVARLMTHQHHVDDSLADSVLASLVADDIYYFETLEMTGTPVVRFQNVDRSHRIFMDSMNEAVAETTGFYYNFSFDSYICYEVEGSQVKITTYTGPSGAKSVSYGRLGSVYSPKGERVRETSAYGRVRFDIKNIIDGSYITKTKDIYCTLEING